MHKNPMPTGERKAGAARCRVRQCNALPLHLRPHTREIADVETQFAARRNGHATKLMHKVCREADAAGLILVLMPHPFSDPDMDVAALEQWYTRSFGFQRIQTLPTVLLARMPGATPRVLQLNPVIEAVCKETK